MYNISFAEAAADAATPNTTTHYFGNSANWNFSDHNVVGKYYALLYRLLSKMRPAQNSNSLVYMFVLNTTKRFFTLCRRLIALKFYLPKKNKFILSKYNGIHATKCKPKSNLVCVVLQTYGNIPNNKPFSK